MVGNEAAAIISYLYKRDTDPEVEDDPWFFYKSWRHKDIEDLATLFTNKHSKIITKELNIYSNNPLIVLRYIAKDTWTAYGLIYSNGAVVMFKTPEEIKYALWISERTAEIFSYPKPQDILL